MEAEIRKLKLELKQKNDDMHMWNKVIVIPCAVLLIVYLIKLLVSNPIF